MGRGRKGRAWWAALPPEKRAELKRRQAERLSGSVSAHHGRDDLAGGRVDHGPGADYDRGDGLVPAGDGPHPRRGGWVVPDVDPLGTHPRAA